MSIPSVTLNDGNLMPQLGLGVWHLADGTEVKQAVTAAIDSGYRLIDTAAAYDNERGVGEAIAESSVDRSELFVTTKVWNSDQGYDSTIRAFDASLQRLNINYIDLYLIHWPAPALGKYLETWRALESLKSSGRVRSIGVCNFTIDHITRLIEIASVVPAINQVELHPRLQQRALRDFCSKMDIQIESWSPIGGSGGDLLNDPTIALIADKHKRTPAQIVLRWHTQLGLVVIPKSANPARITENCTIFDFELDNDDMAKISALNTNTRVGPDPDEMNAH